MKRYSLRTKDREVAERLQDRLDKLWQAGRFDPWKSGALPLGRPAVRPTDVLGAFLESRRKRGRMERTIDTYRSVIGLFMRRYPREKLSEIRFADVESFVWDLSVAPGTRAARDRNLRTFFGWAVREGLLAMSPLEDLDRPPQPEKIPRNVTREELNRICAALRADYQEKRAADACRPGQILWLEPIFRFAFLTGLRASEIAQLRWEDIDLPRRRLYLFRQKSGREEALPLSRKATFVLEGLSEQPSESSSQESSVASLSKNYVFASPNGPRRKRSEKSFAARISKSFSYYRDKAQITRPVTFHGLRHGFCTTLAEAGKSGPVIQAAARHRELSTSMQYVHLSGDYLRKELDEAFG